MNLLLLPQGYLLDGICTKSFISTNDDHKEQLMETFLFIEVVISHALLWICMIVAVAVLIAELVKK